MARTSKYPSVDTAQHALSDFTVRHLEIKIYGIYIDDGYTGTNFDRPLFQKMMEAVAARRVNCIIVKDLSRFGRNYIETGKYLETVFPLLKTRFVSVNDNVDSFENPSSMNSVMIPFKNVMNDEFCRDISVKVRSSLTVKRKQGQFIGSFAPYGYIKDPNDRHKLIIDEEAAQTVRLIYKMFTEGKSVNRLGRYLNDMNIKNIAEYKKSKGFKYRPGGRAETTGYWSDY
ncbi:MAG: recombinase family protein, partial [Clostridiales bacterium]|nr:recombinase family protein [Clostridiales bacterium]